MVKWPPTPNNKHKPILIATINDLKIMIKMTTNNKTTNMTQSYCNNQWLENNDKNDHQQQNNKHDPILLQQSMTWK
jgi:hypothetical protein